MSPYREEHVPCHKWEKLGIDLLSAVLHRASNVYGSRGANISIQQTYCSLLRNMARENIEELVDAWETVEYLYGATAYRNRLNKLLSRAASVVASDYSDIDRMELADAQH